MFSRPSDLITRYPRQYCIHDPEYLCVYFPVHFNNLRRKKETKEIKTIELNSVILQKIDQHNLKDSMSAYEGLSQLSLQPTYYCATMHMILGRICLKN